MLKKWTQPSGVHLIFCLSGSTEARRIRFGCQTWPKVGQSAVKCPEASPALAQRERAALGKHLEPLVPERSQVFQQLSQ